MKNLLKKLRLLDRAFFEFLEKVPTLKEAELTQLAADLVSRNLASLDRLEELKAVYRECENKRVAAVKEVASLSRDKAMLLATLGVPMEAVYEANANIRAAQLAELQKKLKALEPRNLSAEKHLESLSDLPNQTNYHPAKS